MVLRGRGGRIIGPPGAKPLTTSHLLQSQSPTCSSHASGASQFPRTTGDFWKAILSAERESCYHEHRQDLEMRFFNPAGHLPARPSQEERSQGPAEFSPNTPRPNTKHQTRVLPEKVRACTHLQPACGSPQHSRAAGRASRGGQRQGSMRPLRPRWATGQQLWATERGWASKRPPHIVRPPCPRRGLCEEPTPT